MPSSQPQTQFLTDLHAYRWADGVEVQLEKFKEGGDSFSALVTVIHSSDPGEANPMLIAAGRRINFHADRTVSGMAKSLSYRCKQSGVPIEQADWEQRLEGIAWESWKQYQEGSSRLVRLSEVTVDRSKPAFILAPLIPDNGVTIQYGDSSSGKSMFVEAEVLSVCTGKPILGIEPAKVGAVAYFDWEDSEETARERVEAMCEAFEMPVPDNFLYRAMDRSILAGEARIRREVEEHGVVLAVFDSMGVMLNGDPSDPTLVIPAVNVMRRIGVPAVGLHHLSGQQAASKSLADKQKPYGSVYARSGARKQWLLERFQEEEADEGYIYLFNTKVNRGPKSKPMSWQITYENDTQTHYLRSLRYSQRSASDYFDRIKDEESSSIGPSSKVRDILVSIFESSGGTAYPLETLVMKVARVRGETSEQTIRNKLGDLVKDGFLVSFMGESKRVVWALRAVRGDEPAF